MRIRVIAASLAFTAAQPLGAQFPSEVAVGSRVRVVLPDSVRQSSGPWRQQWIRGDVARLAGDTLYLRVQGAAGPVAIRRSAMRRVDRSLGVPSRPESAIRGAVGWAIVGAFLGLATGWPDHYDADDGGRSHGDRALLGAAWGAGAGFILGAILPSERWRRVRLP
jgi:hypothetical protein